MRPDIVFEVSDFVAVFNQTIEYAYPSVSIVGELANLKVSKGRWLYFDVKDDSASVRFFGTVYNLPGPLEDGMRIQVRGTPRLHPQFGFSVSVQQITPVGEGAIKRAADLLKAKLQTEGLFDTARKRPLPYPPQRIGLIASAESAAYADFMKILGHRWAGIDIVHCDVQVQGESAPEQIMNALTSLNAEAGLEVVVLIRGGGSADDLQSFSIEQVVRAVAASRVPVLAAIGHEIDESLVELAADVRASTPSNAAELLVPDKRAVQAMIAEQLRIAQNTMLHTVQVYQNTLSQDVQQLQARMQHCVTTHRSELAVRRQVIHGYDPRRILAAGYAIVSRGGSRIRSITEAEKGLSLQITLQDGQLTAVVTDVHKV